MHDETIAKLLHPHHGWHMYLWCITLFALCLIRGFYGLFFQSSHCCNSVRYFSFCLCFESFELARVDSLGFDYKQTRERERERDFVRAAEPHTRWNSWSFLSLFFFSFNPILLPLCQCANNRLLHCVSNFWNYWSKLFALQFFFLVGTLIQTSFHCNNYMTKRMKRNRTMEHYPMYVGNIARKVQRKKHRSIFFIECIFYAGASNKRHVALCTFVWFMLQKCNKDVMQCRFECKSILCTAEVVNTQQNGEQVFIHTVKLSSCWCKMCMQLEHKSAQKVNINWSKTKKNQTQRNQTQKIDPHDSVFRKTEPDLIDL